MTTVRKLITAVGFVCLCAAGVVADEDPVAVSLTIRSGELRGGFLHGEVNISVVNHLASPLRNVRLRLERPLSGVIGTEGVVEVGDIPVDATGAAIAPIVIDPAFLESTEPYAVRVTLVDVTDSEVEAIVLSLRQVGGGQ